MSETIFKDCKIHIIPFGLGKNRVALFEKQINKYGGTYVSQLDKNNLSLVTHVAVDAESVQDAIKDLQDKYGETATKSLILVKLNWLVECLKSKNRILESTYQIKFPSKSAADTKRKIIEESTGTPTLRKIQKQNPSTSSIQPTTSTTPEFEPPNHAILKELEKLASAFKAKGDTWRNYAYVKAINAIKDYNKEIKSYDEAIAIPSLGHGMASKVWELLETGNLCRTVEVCEGEHAKTLDLFIKVWGAGPKSAQDWYDQGFRTLKDLRTKATLTNEQKIGLKHYDDIQEKIPRDEVTKIAKVVEREAKALFPDLIVEACGSYRRGKASCGDIDIVMSHPTLNISTLLLPPLVSSLKASGFITDSLVNEDDGKHKKFFGLCRLPGEGRKHRRLDLFVIPWEERGPALLHYTGSALFNRSIRLHAQKKGMSLTQHALYGVAIRDGREKVAVGQSLFTPTEESVFEQLGLPYRPPEDRDH